MNKLINSLCKTARLQQGHWRLDRRARRMHSLQNICPQGVVVGPATDSQHILQCISFCGETWATSGWTKSPEPCIGAALQPIASLYRPLRVELSVLLELLERVSLLEESLQLSLSILFPEFDEEDMP